MFEFFFLFIYAKKQFRNVFLQAFEMLNLFCQTRRKSLTTIFLLGKKNCNLCQVNRNVTHPAYITACVLNVEEKS